MSVKKLSFYLTDAHILLRSDHKQLEKFLLKKHAELKGQQLGNGTRGFQHPV